MVGAVVLALAHLADRRSHAQFRHHLPAEVVKGSQPAQRSRAATEGRWFESRQGSGPVVRHAGATLAAMGVGRQSVRVASIDAITVRALTKKYGGFAAVDGIDLDIHTGEVFALLGPNGAGKSTTVEILEGHRRRDAGEVSVLGVDPYGLVGSGVLGSASFFRRRRRTLS